LGIALLACAGVGYLAVRAQNNTARLEQRVTPRLEALAAQLTGAQQQLAALGQTLGLATQSAARVARVAAAVPDEDQDMVNSLLALEGSVSRLEQIVDTAGIESVATNDNIDPAALREVLDEYTQRRTVEALQAALRTRNTEQHLADKQKYGEEIAALYDKARFRWDRGRGRGRDSREERDAAVKELTEKYPDSYAAGMVVAERAVGAMFHGNYTDVEKYYEQISNNRNHDAVVTDWGFEAVPTLQYNLARYYIEQNRRGDAERLLNSLEKNYGNSLLPPMGPGRDHSPQTAARAAQELRQRMQR
jgi:hypothetical protein